MLSLQSFIQRRQKDVMNWACEKSVWQNQCTRARGGWVDRKTHFHPRNADKQRVFIDWKRGNWRLGVSFSLLYFRGRSRRQCERDRPNPNPNPYIHACIVLSSNEPCLSTSQVWGRAAVGYPRTKHSIRMTHVVHWRKRSGHPVPNLEFQFGIAGTKLGIRRKSIKTRTYEKLR